MFWDALSDEEQEKFAPLCPDFVAELRAPSDHLATLEAKMDDYIQNGARLGWLLDPIEKRVYVYRPGRKVEVLNNPTRVEGEDVLKGLVVDLQEIL